MRLWTLDPTYLDRQGLLACWREALLAKAVLEGKTKGYRNHPQLDRFRQSGNPIAAINRYLSFILVEAQSRGYRFDESKIDYYEADIRLPVTSGQVRFEVEHLGAKIERRRGEPRFRLPENRPAFLHPMFYVTDSSQREPWEKG